MLLTDILKPGCIALPMRAQEKRDAIEELVDLLAAEDDLDDADELKEAIWERETTRTTGIGHHIAIPHGKAQHCDRLMMAVGKPAQPLEFGAIDRKPVRIIFLLASPLDQTGPHIQALATISRMLTEPDVRETLLDIDEPHKLYDFIQQREAELAEQSSG